MYAGINPNVTQLWPELAHNGSKIVIASNAVAVGVGDRSGDLRRQSQSFLGRYRSVERVAVQILHDQEVNAILIADVVQGTDVRMIQRGDRASFLLETLACLRIIGQVRGQDLDGDRTIEPGVSRLVDLTHPTSPDARPTTYGPILCPSRLLVMPVAFNDWADDRAEELCARS